MDARGIILRTSLGKMLTGITWQFTIILLVLVEVAINLVLMCISLNAINDSEQHFASRLLHFVGISILAIFALEVFLKLFALGIEYFKIEKLEIFDAVIVITALIVEILLSATHTSKAWKSLGFVIGLRLWRVCRVITNIIEFREELYELIDESDGRSKRPTSSATETLHTERESLHETK
ncbi:voltage-gated hydrogen channel 1 isoform X2 [Nematostella vectensis]|uniref:voltage-gated hydrogen channel 1 isoform X2 n=1 Tax=Nematostella vectensis TaxID=45351 RepID=UPI0013901EEF|nr:voltage-gated hydrogen channel 1 isoform X2 [Nematostella vectensis]